MNGPRPLPPGWLALALLAPLPALTALDCSLTEVCDLRPLAASTALRKLNCSGLHALVSLSGR